MADIDFSALSFAYPRHPARVLDGLDLHINSGEFVCVIGQSGCGKSTLLHMLAGLLLPGEGELRIDGRLVSGPDTDRALVFQQSSLFPWMTALKNVSFGIRQANRKMTRAEAKQRAMECLNMVNMAGHYNKYPNEMSGGMQQRTAIARALGMDADILLLDEPFGALDAKTRADLQALLCCLWGCADRTKEKKTVVFITHDIDEAILLGDRILYMAGGKIQADVSVPFARPRDQGALVYTTDYRDFKAELLDRFHQESGESLYDTEKGA